MLTHIAVGVHVADIAAREGSPHNVLHSSSLSDALLKNFCRPKETLIQLVKATYV